MECAAKGSVASRCTRRFAQRSCPGCSAVSYCSVSHQVSHWTHHKEECARLKQQLLRAKVMNDFPFTFCARNTSLGQNESVTKCDILIAKGLHQKGLWNFECTCAPLVASSYYSVVDDEWHLPSSLCPCLEPKLPLYSKLRDWKDYFQWRCLPLDSPVALLLHWPLTAYRCFQLVSLPYISPEVGGNFHIHYLGPGKELQQLAIFGELHALFPGVSLHIEFIGPEIPDLRDNEKMTLRKYARCSEDGCACNTTIFSGHQGSGASSCSVTLRLRKGFYHERFNEVVEELIQRIGVPAFFSDFCEEAANLGASSIEKSTGKPLTIPVQVNPFRQPMPVEGSALRIPCYSNCFLFGM
ncbi:zinc ion binding protein isoform X2 [Wolffia australiana]